MSTEDFERGQRVRINLPGNVCHDMAGTVVDRDAYCVEVRLDTVTPAMMGYGDTKKGLISLEPQYLVNL